MVFSVISISADYEWAAAGVSVSQCRRSNAFPKSDPSKTGLGLSIMDLQPGNGTAGEVGAARGRVWSTAFRRQGGGDRLKPGLQTRRPDRLKAELRTVTTLDRPRLDRNRRLDIRARFVWPRPGSFWPDIPAHCSKASPSSARRSGDAPGCDARNSASRENVGRSASPVPLRGRIPCARESVPRHSKRVTFVRETCPTRLTGPEYWELPRVRDNGLAARTTRTSAGNAQ